MELKKILIIEDDPEIGLLIDLCLKKIVNSQIQRADNMHQAELSLKDQGAQLIFLDLNLPDTYDFSHIKRIKTRYPKAFLTVMSAYDSPLEQHLAKRLGADAFIGKPFYQHQIIWACAQAHLC